MPILAIHQKSPVNWEVAFPRWHTHTESPIIELELKNKHSMFCLLNSFSERMVYHSYSWSILINLYYYLLILDCYVSSWLI